MSTPSIPGAGLASRTRLRGPEAPSAASPVRRKSVCIITQNYSFGGMEVHTLGLMRAFIDRGFTVELIANAYDRYDAIVHESGWDEVVRIVHTNLGGILYGERSNRREWRTILNGLQSETLLFPKGNYNYGHLGFLRECRRVFKKIVFVEHKPAYARPAASQRWLGIVPGIGLWWYKRKIHSRLGARYADKVVAVSDDVEERLVSEIGFPPSKVLVVRNGVPWRDFARSAADGLAFRAAHGIPSDAFVFGMLCRLNVEKGVDTALHALRALAARRPARDYYLIIAGEGTEAEALRTLCERLELEDRVRFIGFVRQPAQVLPGFDVILFPSRTEGIPLALLQGMSAGCIPVVTRVGGMPDVVNAPDLGWVVSPDQPEELSDALNAVLSLEPARLEEMRRQALRRVQESFDIDASNQIILDLCGA